MNSFLTGSINKIWGSSSHDLYIVGNNGNIANHNGTNWQKIESASGVYLYRLKANDYVDVKKMILLK